MDTPHQCDVIIYSRSDDNICTVWDKHCFNAGQAIGNGKDQTALRFQKDVF